MSDSYLTNKELSKLQGDNGLKLSIRLWERWNWTRMDGTRATLNRGRQQLAIKELSRMEYVKPLG